MRKKFNKNGLIIIRNILNNSERKKILNIFFDVLNKYINIPARIRNLDNNILHKKLTTLRKRNPKKFGQLYDELKLNARLRSVLCSEKFIKLGSKILNVNKNLIFINGFQLRLDAPNDKRNTYSWHQDSAFYLHTYPKFNAFVCWLPLTHNTAKNGTLQYIPKSHSRFIKTSFNKKSKLGSLQYKVNVNKNKKIKNFDAKLGEAGIFHMNLIHRSGVNSSKKFRITLAFRCHDLSKTFNIGKEYFIYNNKNIYKKATVSLRKLLI